MKIVIIGGVGAGASMAARLRRLSKDDKIIILEKGNYVSYANCGLPYYVSNVISSRDDLLLMTPQLFKSRFQIDVRVQNEVIKIDAENKK
ncbi:FAD-dependent oxidoreductase [Coprobacillaceae bacterium CR2/5/TPMF4]|nr:FAD-dependent oxidoreductase [Coprobacillaceae bacterium CR2/5/TPMF4]